MARHHGGRSDRGSYLLSESIASLMSRAVYEGWAVVVDADRRGDYRVSVYDAERQRLTASVHRALKEALRLAVLAAYNAPKQEGKASPPVVLSPEMISTTLSSSTEVVA